MTNTNNSISDAHRDHAFLGFIVAVIVGGAMYVTGHAVGFQKGRAEGKALPPSAVQVQQACQGMHRGTLGPRYYTDACMGRNTLNIF